MRRTSGRIGTVGCVKRLLWLVFVLILLFVSVQTLLQRARDSTNLDHDDATCSQYRVAPVSDRTEFAAYWLRQFRDHDGKAEALDLIDDFRDDIGEGCAGEAAATKAATAASRVYVAGRDLYSR
jgi:hypothetical protein